MGESIDTSIRKSLYRPDISFLCGIYLFFLLFSPIGWLAKKKKKRKLSTLAALERDEANYSTCGSSFRSVALLLFSSFSFSWL
jgi:hypothetical protein